MCRVLAYLGAPVLLDDFLYKPDSSLIRQTYDPQMLSMLNLAGFGMAAWDPSSHDPGSPFLYRTSEVPIFDANLKTLAEKVRPSALLAHVRGVPYSHLAQVGLHNVHPFRYHVSPLAMAHNGDLARFSEMRHDLLDHVRPEIARHIAGTTDSEWMYAVLLSQLDDPVNPSSTAELVEALECTLRIIRQVRDRRGIRTTSSANLFLCDGSSLVATRFSFDFGCYEDQVRSIDLSYLSLWYTTGSSYGLHDKEWKMVGGAARADSVIVASEPLTHDVSTWVQVPEYSVLWVTTNGTHLTVRTRELDI